MSRIVADVIVVGGGIVGCSVAYHLVQRRGVRVLVVEKGSVAAGMTRRSGALIRTPLTHPTEAQLALASRKFFRQWKEHVGASCGFTPTGLVVVASAEQATRLREQTAQVQALGAQVQMLSPDAVRELQPTARVDDIALAMYEPEAGFVDPLLATQTLAARVKELGGTFKTGTFVKQIRVEYGRVTGIETSIGLMESLNVVLCAGVWTDRLLRPLKIELGLRTPRASVAFFQRPTDLSAGHLAFDDWITGASFRPHSFGLTMAMLNTADEEVNPDAFDESVSAAFVREVQQRIAARVPSLAQARYLRGHAGVYDASPAGRALVGRVPGVSGLFVAAGLGSIGLTMAPAVGACLAEWVLDGEARTVDVSALSVRRET
jgi:sarcosine oxidase subunit beta